MSYDVTVFDPASAPADPDDYVDWIEGLSADDASDPVPGLADIPGQLRRAIPGFDDYAESTMVGPTLQMRFPFDRAGEVMPVLMDLIIAAGLGLEVESEGIMIRDPEALKNFSRMGIRAIGDIEGVIYVD